MSDLLLFIRAFHRKQAGRAINPAHADFAAAFKADPALLDEARAELARLDQLDADLTGKLHQRDYDQGTRLTALRAMLDQYNRTDGK